MDPLSDLPNCSTTSSPLLPPLESGIELDTNPGLIRLQRRGTSQQVEHDSVDYAETSSRSLLQIKQPLQSSPLPGSEHPIEDLEKSYWMPTSLKRNFLLSLAALSLCLSICCFVLVSVSHYKNGLANAGSSGGFNFRKRFLPTFVAVLYTLLWAPVVADVIRTEPWALLSRATGSKANDSLLKRDQMWWNHVADAIRARKRLSGVRWPLLLAVISSITSSLVINPLSAGLLDTASITSTKENSFMTVGPLDVLSNVLHVGDATYLRAVSNIIFSISTSAWNTDRYSVVPFWPSSLADVPLSATLTPERQIWTGNSTIVSLRLRCQPLVSRINRTENEGEYPRTYLQTSDGCGVIAPSRGSYMCNSYDRGGSWGQINVRERLSII